MMAYKVAVNTELANTITLRKNASAWLQAFLSTAQYITVFSVCLFKDTVFNTYCGFIHIKVMANHSETHAD